MVVNMFYIYELWLFLGRKIVSVVVVNAARQTVLMYVRAVLTDLKPLDQLLVMAYVCGCVGGITAWFRDKVGFML